MRFPQVSNVWLDADPVLSIYMGGNGTPCIEIRERGGELHESVGIFITNGDAIKLRKAVKAFNAVMNEDAIQQAAE